MLDRTQHGGDRRQMDHRVDAAVEGALERVRIRDIALYEVDIRIWMRLQVDDAWVRARCAEVSDDVATDEPGAAGDEDSTSVQRPGTGARHVPASADGARRSLAVARQLTLGMIAARSTRSL